MRLFVILLIVLGPLSLFAQDYDPDQLIEKLIAKYDRIESYSADVEIDVDVEFIKMPVKKARIFYKKPDRFKVEADGFVLLPKKGMKFSIETFIEQPYKAILSGTEVFKERELAVVKIIPLVNESDFVLATLWIDPLMNIIYKIETHTKNMGSFSVDLFYDHNPYDLPVKQQIQFEIENFKIPLKFAGKISIDTDMETQKSRGQVTVLYSNFKVNIEISDEMFNEMQKEFDDIMIK
ncbi:MAG: hypothetical protein JEZ03_12645 [Bacteroidales bacterium]|nr:hypothetical protein [Bacteroidales bacterium]